MYHHIQGIPKVRLSADFSSETWRPKDLWTNTFKVLKTVVNQESYTWQNFPSAENEKLRLQINKSWGSLWPLDLPCRKCPRFFLPGKNERTSDSNSKPYGDIKISVKVNTWAVIKASIIVTLIWNCTFCFLPDLRLAHLNEKNLQLLV